MPTEAERTWFICSVMIVRPFPRIVFLMEPVCSIIIAPRGESYQAALSTRKQGPPNLFRIFGLLTIRQEGKRFQSRLYHRKRIKTGMVWESSACSFASLNVTLLMRQTE